MLKLVIIVCIAFVFLVGYVVWLDANTIDGYLDGKLYHLRDVCVEGHNEVSTIYGLGPGNVMMMTTWHCDVSRIDTVFFPQEVAN